MTLSRQRQNGGSGLVTAAVLSLVASLPLLGGCSDSVENKGSDTSFIRMPDALDGERAKTNGPLLPTTPGSYWKFLVHTNDSDKTRSEEDRVAGPMTVDGRTGTAVTLTQEGRKPFCEVFQTTAQGFLLLASGPANDLMTLSPPMVVAALPVKNGSVAEWNGVLRYRGKTIPGEGLTRVSGLSKIKTRKGDIDAYTIDTLIMTTVNGQQVAFPSVRWLAPGIGLVHERTQNGNEIQEKDLVDYAIAAVKHP